MSVASFLQSAHPTAFSFELLPPLRGKSIESLYRTIERLLPFGPAYINITTHRSETIYHEVSDGRFERLSLRNRPGVCIHAHRAVHGQPQDPGGVHGKP